jgi:hypothetical protein
MLFDRCTARPRANLSELPARKGTGVSGVAPKAAPGRFQGDKKADSTGRPGVCDPMNLSFSEMTLAPSLAAVCEPVGERIAGRGLPAFVHRERLGVRPGTRPWLLSTVQFGEDGQPLAIRYHFVYAMLLNEVQQQHSTIAGQSARLAEQAARLEDQARTLDRQSSEIAGQRAKLASQQTAIEELALRLAKLEGH